MTFLDFCRLHGVIIDALPPIGSWKRYRTTDKPAHRNGAVKFMGDHGFVQNHATMQDVSSWRAEGGAKAALQEVRRIAEDGARETARNNARAAEEAARMLSCAQRERHAYFASKGFPEEVVNVLRTDAGPIALIPMFVQGELVGCQRISEDGGKKFLAGQRSSRAEFVFNNKGPHVLCEGYATALSARLALANIKRPYTLHVCFSAGNMKKVAAGLPGGIVLADNDKSGTGERVAREIGWPYWMSDAVGEDANDFHRRQGLFALSQGLQRTLREAMAVP
ncbi:hypothetical protein ABL840_09075 [Variovorax sp. NFACC27]|uniref:hypothetical protein n=1 Tax=unclassified Variovorax TaxID=663243 RepID=UPI00089958AF|nr:putative DNA primase/helicase [Variovorax sp. NFACC28]SEG89610.1 putative DNA primase/helicase [Variovorax sp. NFACC29]SFD40511.1 putative DNA primase/helicase [Variovorax sp. NFACC26]SFG42741.1 putative DNA primase/helicase [Variovorax sp. NFACC27]